MRELMWASVASARITGPTPLFKCFVERCTGYKLFHLTGHEGGGMSILERPTEQDRALLAAKNQSLFREVNERVRYVNDGFGFVVPLGEWICECADASCVERIAMSSSEYEAVRAHGDRFFVLADDAHVWDDVERVVARHPHYWIVEKSGDAREAVMRLDPRARTKPLRLRT
jgi:hypothetical protein